VWPEEYTPATKQTALTINKPEKTKLASPPSFFLLPLSTSAHPQGKNSPLSIPSHPFSIQISSATTTHSLLLPLRARKRKIQHLTTAHRCSPLLTAAHRCWDASRRVSPTHFHLPFITSIDSITSSITNALIPSRLAAESAHISLHSPPAAACPNLLPYTLISYHARRHVRNHR
jgi:hypothetical protein